MNEIFSLRIVYFDYYHLELNNKNIYNDLVTCNNITKDIFSLITCPNYNHFMKRQILFVPIIRIFGSTYRGQKCSLNIHNYFPYFYIEITSDNSFPLVSPESEKLLREYAYCLENSYLKLESNVKLPQIIHRIEVVKKFKFYGYSKEKVNFLKVYVYESKFIKGLMSILHNSIIRGRYYQCYEAHLSYCMHFFSDFDLYGMNHIKLTNFSFRFDIPKKVEINYNDNLFINNITWGKSSCIYENENNNSNNKSHQIWDHFHYHKLIFNNLKKSSKSSVELDVDCRDIINKDELKSILLDTTNAFEPNHNLPSCYSFINYTKTLIDLWLEEENYCSHNNKEALKFEKISDQNNFILVHDLILVDNKLSRDLISKNIKKINFSDFNISEELELEKFERKQRNYDLFISEERLKMLLNKTRNNYHKKMYGNWKLHKRSNFYSKANDLFTNINQSDNIYNTNDYIDADEIKSLSELSQLSLNIPTRNRIKDILTTKSLDEYFSKSDNENEIENNNNNILSSNTNTNEHDLENNYKILKLSQNKQKTDQLEINFENFNKIYKNIYTFKSKAANYFDINDKLINRSYHFNLKINKHLLCLYYSDILDYERFQDQNNKSNRNLNQLRLNKNKFVKNHRGLNLFIHDYNKIIKPPCEILSKGINKRKNEIQKLLKKLNIGRGSSEITINEVNDKTTCNAKSNNIFPFENLKVHNYLNLIFKPSINQTPSTKREISEKIEKNLIKIKLKKQIDVCYYNRKFNTENSSNNNNNISLNTSLYSNRLSLTNYNNEVSPITEKKNINKLDLNTHSFTATLDTSLAPMQYQGNFNLTVFSVEVICNGRWDLTWNPEEDNILTIVCAVHDQSACNNLENYNHYKFIITSITNRSMSKRFRHSNFIIAPEFMGYKSDEIDYSNLVEVFHVKDESQVISKFFEIFTLYDPDLIIGYETEILSIGYIVRRAEFLGFPIRNMLSRCITYNKASNNNLAINIRNKQKNTNNITPQDNKEIKYLEQKFGKIIKLRGRIIVNLWRLLETELKLTNYKIENVVFHVLKTREPLFTNSYLLNAYNSGDPRQITFVFNYYIKRVSYNLQLIEALDLINREAQFTKIYGIDFESSLTRGSQYRVEGVLCRVTKANDYVLLSASREQVRRQDSPEFIPMVIEPPKNIFYSPVVILDFQSLYPSIIIAYNICYSTCLGKLFEDEQTLKKYKEDFLMFNEDFKK